MIIFQNQGLIPIDAFTTFGINAKPNSDNPIGYFGTGLKYAVAVTLRLGGTFRLFRGIEEYEFYLKEKDFRGKSFQTVRMRKRKSLMARWSYDKLPFTTELGKNWKPWMAIRELESNTRDENGHSCLFHEHDDPHPDYTMIIIECPEMEEAYRAKTHYEKTHKGLPTETFDVTLTREQLEYITGNYGCLSDLRPDIMQVFTDALEDE